ncbi:MAG TPA: ATP-grasp domain-containing protein, partial [Gemmatimonadaceae bacterium]|nr:ATP-grasp domain-containing protein [Gemmatimonadaceae bacterium]
SSPRKRGPMLPGSNMGPRFRGDDDGVGDDDRVARVLLVGVSTRALAESAVGAGYEVLSVDGYGDLDNPASPALSLARDFGVEYTAHAAAAAAAGLELDYDAVCYGSSLENHPRDVALLASRAELWGNPPAVLRRARNAVALSRLLRSRLGAGALVRASAGDSSREWLMKPRASGGGHDITEWHSGSALPRTHVLQERIDGTPGSIAFVAHDGDSVPFAISRQLVGDTRFAASAFQYCGSILSSCPGSVIDAATDSAHLLAEELDLTGLACLDFVVSRDGIPHAIELNPRYSASMELAERAFGYSVFAAHARACARRGNHRSARFSHHPDERFTHLPAKRPTDHPAAPLPRLDLAASLRSVGALGKAVLFAPTTLVMPDTRPWLTDPDVRDIPHPGETIPRGHPVCTIFATARDDSACYEMLVRKAGEMYEEMKESREQKAESSEDPRVHGYRVQGSGFRVQGLPGGRDLDSEVVPEP